MAYTKTTWVDGVTPVSAQNMNNLETQYEKAKADLDTHKAETATEIELGHVKVDNKTIFANNGIISTQFEKIAEINIETAVLAIDFDNLSDYKQLKLVGFNLVTTYNFYSDIRIKFNQDGASNYVYDAFTTNEAGVTSRNEYTSGYIELTHALRQSSLVGYKGGLFELDIYNNNEKYFDGKQASHSPTNARRSLNGMWNSANIINSINLSSTREIAAGSTFVLLGVK